MTRARGLLGAAGLAALLSGCGHVETHAVLLRQQGPPTPGAQVYFADQQPPRPFFEVGLVQAIGYGDDANLEDVAHGLAKRAASLGCDAVVRVHVDLGWARAHGYGVCVRWSPVWPAPAPALRPAPPPTPPPAPVPAASPAPGDEPI